MEDKEKLAKWMLDRGLATGHGDSIDDLLVELGGQLGELRAEAVREAVERTQITVEVYGQMGQICYSQDLLDQADEIERWVG